MKFLNYSFAIQKNVIKRDRTNKKIEENSKKSENWKATGKPTLQIVFASLSCINKT